jgi:hypothetical protein
MALWNTAARDAGHSAPAFATSVTFAIFALATIGPALVLGWVTPAPLFLPSLSLLSLAIAGGLALLAWLLRVRRQTDDVNLWDVAGVCAFIGFAAGMLSQPEHVLGLFGHTSAGQ